jgi:hemerythrin-like domain-containing protein
MVYKSSDRRTFVRQSIIAGTGAMIFAPALLSSCHKESEEDISPAEDLMREHGLLNRILLIYDHCRNGISNHEDIPLQPLTESAGIIRHFIEDYHEKLEEDFLFPRFEKANQLTELVAILRVQHKAGRDITEQISGLSKQDKLTQDESSKMIALLSDFNRMYRPHEAREDTVLFPALRKILSKHEYDSLGEDFEKKEQELFGKDGFESMVDKVSDIEKQLGIYDLSKFTPPQ